ncbi:hypothetical protein P5V15_014480 [Pogonomyrmex californicus]
MPRFCRKRKPMWMRLQQTRLCVREARPRAHNLYIRSATRRELQLHRDVQLHANYHESRNERYDTAYACEGKTLEIECGEGKLIHLIRANYGRFSITICNEHGNTEWSVNCMSPKSFRVLNNDFPPSNQQNGAYIKRREQKKKKIKSQVREPKSEAQTASHGRANWPIAGPLKGASRDGSTRKSRNISDNFAITIHARIRFVSLAAAKS